MCGSSCTVGCGAASNNMLTLEQLEAIQADCLADDIDIELDVMQHWTEEQVTAFFESGGMERPPMAAAAALPAAPSERSFDSPRSSADARAAREATEEITGDAATGAFAFDWEDALDSSEPRHEDALLDAPMASVPVTQRQAASDELQSWSVGQLKSFLQQRGVDLTGVLGKDELRGEVRGRLQAEEASGGGSSQQPPPQPPQPQQMDAATQRARRKVEEIKALGDAAFRVADHEKALRHYSSALSKATDLAATLKASAPAAAAELLAALYSNRSATHAQLRRLDEALLDGQHALKLRPTWGRAFSRVGYALFALRRYDEAAATYERGVQTEPHSDELRKGLAMVLRARGESAEGSAAAAQAKARGNAAFQAASHAKAAGGAAALGPLSDNLHAALEAYDEALRLAPSDASLHSNRSAALAMLGRWDEALQAGKRAVALDPSWGKAYSRCGVASLRGGDVEGAYWFYANGLRHEPRDAELLQGRHAALRALAETDTPRHERRVAACTRDARRPPARLLVVSDVHYDHPGAREWADSLSRTSYQDDALVVAGDVGDTFVAVRYCLRAFKERFRRVLYVPGNHDLWLRPKGQHSDEPARFADSVAKLLALWQLCDELGVDTGPAQLSPQLAVLPLDSWYSCEFDKHDPRPGGVRFDSFCKWPVPELEAARLMLRLNEARLALPLRGDVVSFSHFLPRQELPIPGGLAEMAKGVGTVELDEQLRRAGAKLHIFGHTHINSTHQIDGVRYMQCAMGYGIRPGAKLTVVHDSGRFKEYLA